MPSLENFDDKVKINGIPYPKDSLNYQVSDGRLSVYPVGFPERIIQQGKGIGIFSDWNKGTEDSEYLSIDELTGDLDSFLFIQPSSSAGIIQELRANNQLLESMLIYLQVISVQLQGIEEDGGNFGVDELKRKIITN